MRRKRDPAWSFDRLPPMRFDRMPVTRFIPDDRQMKQKRLVGRRYLGKKIGDVIRGYASRIFQEGYDLVISR